jgi:uncharacterized membrane protein YeaQ/YmgE (transglycosylase-associated protein family)
MLQFLDPDNYSPQLLYLVVLGVVSAGIFAGYITDLIMGDRGFGFFGNGFLAILGAATGIYTRYAFFGWLRGQDMLVTGIFALAATILLLLLLGFAKNWVQD